MDERKLLAHAKNYVDQLARGADPLSDRAVPEDSVLHQERLVKCFQYVSQVLQRELDRFRGPEETPEEVSGEAPVEISVNSFMEELCVSLGYTKNPRFLNRAVYHWLVQEGYLQEWSNESAASVYRPTQKWAGLEPSERPFGYTVSCGEQMQQLLRDNLEQIIACNLARWNPLLDCLTPEWHSSAACAETPVTITAMLKQVNSQLPENLPQKISAKDLSNWLVWKGLLESVVIRKNRSRVPTRKGISLGIESGTYTQKNGKVLWSAAAQQFILDNLNGIVQEIASGEAYRWGPQELVLTDQVRSSLKPQPKPVGPAYLETVINNALGYGKEYPNLVPRGLISSWLYQEGYFTRPENPGGETASPCAPTEKGKAAGVVISEGHLLLNEAGQRLIYDNVQQLYDYCKTL